MRVGSTNRIADQTMVTELNRSVRPTGYDEEPMLELNSEAIDFRAASESFATILEEKGTHFRATLLLCRIVEPSMDEKNQSNFTTLSIAEGKSTVPMRKRPLICIMLNDE